MGDGDRLEETDAAVVRSIRDALDELAEDPVGIGLAQIDFGGAEVWEASRYEIAEQLYDRFFLEQMRNRSNIDDPRGHRTSIAERLRTNAASARPHASFFLGTLDASLRPVGELLESIRYRARRRTMPPLPGAADLMVAGFVSSNGPHMLTKTLPELERALRSPPLVLEHDDLLNRQARALEAIGARAFTVEHALTPSARRRAHRAASEASTMLERANPKDQRARAAIADAIRDGGALSRARLRRAAIHASAVDATLPIVSPTVVAVADERLVHARAAALIARRVAPPISFPDPVDILIRRAPLLGASLAPTIFAFAPQARELLTRAGSANAEVLVHPWPMLSGILAYRTGDGRERFRASVGAGPKTRIVLFAAQARASDSTIIEELRTSVGMIKDALLVVRPHPIQSTALFRAAYPSVIVSRTTTSLEAVDGADVLVTHSSSMALEAAALGRSAIIRAATPQLLLLLFSGTASWAPTISALRSALEDAIGPAPASRSSARASFRSQLGVRDGRAAVDHIVQRARGALAFVPSAFEDATSQLVRCVESAKLGVEPFPILILERCFDDALYRRIRHHLPDPSLHRAIDHQDAFRADGTSTRSVFVLDSENISTLSLPFQETWTRVRIALSSSELKKAIFKRLSSELASRFQIDPLEAEAIDAFPSLGLTRDEPGFKIRPHPDSKTKILTVQLYLAGRPDQQGLGTTMYLEPTTPYCTIAFRPNSGYAFAVSDRSWHAREALPEVLKEIRYTLALTYYHPGARPYTLVPDRAAETIRT